MTQKIILASQSPRRKQLLEWAHVEFDVLVSDTDESYPSGLTNNEVAIYIAQKKALAVKSKHPSNISILAADTIVVCDQQIIGKPKDRAEAIKTIQQLSGKVHQVITGVCLLKGDEANTFSETTEVCFYELTQAQIEFYVDNYQPYDKAGAYAIQEWIGVVGIQYIKGDFYNVMGLPVARVMKLIE